MYVDIRRVKYLSNTKIMKLIHFTLVQKYVQCVDLSKYFLKFSKIILYRKYVCTSASSIQNIIDSK